MDVSTAGAALAITVLRLLHIVAGLLWVGAALMMSLYIEPTAAASGADGKRFLRALYTASRTFARLIPLSASVTTVAGLLLYGMLSYHEAMSSPMGVILSIGALFGLLAFGHGYFTVWRRAGEYARLASAAEANEGDARDRLRRRCGAMGA